MDHVFPTYFTILSGHDLVIIHMTPGTVANRVFIFIKGKDCLVRELFLFYEHELILNSELHGLSLSDASLVLFDYRPVLGRIVNLDRILNTEYIQVLKIDRIRILNSGIRSQLFE